MIIVVNAHLWEGSQDEMLSPFIKEVVLRTMARQKEHQFYLLSDAKLTDTTSLPANVINLVFPVSKHLVLRNYWLDVKLPLLLRKLGASAYVATGGVASLMAKVPLCLILKEADLFQVSNKKLGSAPSYYKPGLLRFIQKAKAVIVPSAFLMHTIHKEYVVPESKIKVLPYAVADAFKPVSFELKESLKALYAQGQEYFVYKGLIHADQNLINLLKAFSLFKKRQQSSWKLVLAGTYKEGKNEFPALLESYKYKEDLFVTGPLTTIEQAEVIGSAYALISPSLSEEVNSALWEAIQCEVPVLAADTATNKEIGQEGFLYFEGTEPPAIAEKIMQVYKDDKERLRLIESAKELKKTRSWDIAMDSLWQGILLAANS